jgi:hypothetical protein
MFWEVDLAFMTNKKNAFFNSANGWTGVQPGMKYEYFPPVGTATFNEWAKEGWDKGDATAFLDAYYKKSCAARAANLSTNSRGRRVLARTRRPCVVSIGG